MQSSPDGDGEAPSLSPGSSPSSHIQSITDTLRTQYWSWIVLDYRCVPSRLVNFLVQKLPHIDTTSWQQRFDFGGIYVNGREAHADLELPIPCKVEYYEPKFDIAYAHQVFPEFRDEYIIHRDDHIVVVYKPPGLSSMPAKEQRHFSVKASVERHIGATVHMPSRLDVSAQGLIVMSCSTDTHAQLQQAFEHRRVRKEYLCASHSRSQWQTKRVDLSIARDPLHPVLRRIAQKDGQVAVTEFSSLGQSTSDHSSVQVFRALPITGRTHQIRVHAAASGIPLTGDRFYGGAPARYLHLVSYSITITHPITKKTFKITLPEPLIPDWIRECEYLR